MLSFWEKKPDILKNCKIQRPCRVTTNYPPLVIHGACAAMRVHAWAPSAHGRERAHDSRCLRKSRPHFRRRRMGRGWWQFPAGSVLLISHVSCWFLIPALPLSRWICPAGVPCTLKDEGRECPQKRGPRGLGPFWVTESLPLYAGRRRRPRLGAPSWLSALSASSPLDLAPSFSSTVHAWLQRAAVT